MKNVTGVLITGGGGFLGSHLAEYYLKQNLPVVCVDNFCTGLRTNEQYLKKLPQNKNLTFVEADIIPTWERWTNELSSDLKKKISHVFHFASPASPPLYQDIPFETLWSNSVGLDHALKFADSVGARVIYASTSEVYGDPSLSPQPESYWGNVNSFGVRACYDEAKRFGEALLYTHNWKKKTNHGLVRIFNTYGPRMNPTDGRVIINFLVQGLKGEALTVYGDGKQTRSFCYVSDLTEAIVRYAKNDICEPVNIGNTKEFSILELAQMVQDIYQPQKLSIKHMELPKDDPKQRCPDTELAKKLLAGWQPKVSLREGLLQMRQWLEEDPLAMKALK